MSGSPPEKISEEVLVVVNGDELINFRADKVNIEITRHQVVITAACRDTYEDKVLINSEAMEALGYKRDLSNIPAPKRRWWFR